MSTTVSKEKSKIFETVLSSPGMNQKCKINLVMSRQNVLLLSRLIEAALLTDQQEIDDEIINALPKESLEEFKTVHEEILRKSNLTEFYEKLRSL
jgi:hypothetical protein